MEYIVNKFKVALLAENERHNLVSRKSLAEEFDKHIEDSLHICTLFDLSGLRGADIGTGAGFPGLIMAMALPDNYISLIEPDLKKSNFLQRMKNELSLGKVEVIKSRAEEVGHNPEYRASYDFCTSRAVTSINILLEYGIPLLKIGGKMFLWKGQNYKQELEQASNALQILNASVINIYHYTLINNLSRAMVIIEKQANTPDKYPRRIGIPAKRPL
ncbi:MAG TPA: 16S rRNA (guanine(527)-N(7))-methyltransferase RsmG [Syntrophomonadaceae bacterium]|nr:16S rRNA (guanine(527)-N(7))-methyltransferase RsmG [Syntrophomonadaceae bacterium]HPR93964.1 16S rRNA (guanine(527)-N(7))-methyltransferase RsmG [Syntrophomonadaceae bacterium]